MTYAVVGGLIVVVILVVVWLRFSAARSDRRSMETYGHALGVLGDVAKRTGPSPSVRVLPRGEPGRAHVRASASDGPSTPPSSGRPSGAGTSDSLATDPPRGRIGGAGARPANAGATPTGAGATPTGAGAAGGFSVRAYRQPSASIPVPEHEVSFDDIGEEWAGAARPVLRESADRLASRDRADRAERSQGAGAGPDLTDLGGEGGTAAPVVEPSIGEAEPMLEPVVIQQSISPDELRRQATVRRLATGSFAVIAVIAIVAASIQLSGNPPAKPKTAPNGGHHATPTTRPPPTTAVTPTTVKPAVVEPLSTSGNEVTFQAPSGHFLLTFSAITGPCYVAVETGIGTGDYLWSGLVQPGTPATYKGTGSFVLALGAPAYMSVSMNGVPLRIPAGVADDYIAFESHS